MDRHVARGRDALDRDDGTDGPHRSAGFGVEVGARTEAVLETTLLPGRPWRAAVEAEPGIALEHGVGGGRREIEGRGQHLLDAASFLDRLAQIEVAPGSTPPCRLLAWTQPA